MECGEPIAQEAVVSVDPVPSRSPPPRGAPGPGAPSKSTPPQGAPAPHGGRPMPAAQAMPSAGVQRTFTAPESPAALRAKPKAAVRRRDPDEEKIRCPGCGIPSAAERCPGCGIRLRSDE